MRRLSPSGVAVMLALAAAAPAAASHSWGNYHWARTTASFNLQVVDSVTARWQYAFDQSLAEWNKSTALENVVTAVEESDRTRKRCPMAAGKMRVCNASYGKNGWLGLASINLDSRGHITQGTAKMNDSYGYYFDRTPGEDNHVMCQEIGHVYGLGHTSEDGSTQNTCMDYSTSLTSQWPNAHDYSQLSSIYSHLDNYNSYAISSAATSSTATPAGVPLGAVRVHHTLAGHDHLGHADYVMPDGKGGLWLFHLTLVHEDDHTH